MNKRKSHHIANNIAKAYFQLGYEPDLFSLANNCSSENPSLTTRLWLSPKQTKLIGNFNDLNAEQRKVSCIVKFF